MRKDLGELSDLAALDRLIDVTGLDLIEVGCAAGDTARALVERGARVTGIEPDPVQAEKNRAAASTPGLTFIEAGAETLPAGDGTIDGVLMFRSLHHVPMDLMARALGEAARVIKSDGFLYVAEPGTYGGHFSVTHAFHDETAVREHAQQTLAEVAPRLFDTVEDYLYRTHVRHADFESLIANYTAMSYNRITRDMIDKPEIRAAFEATATAEGHVLDVPMLVTLCRGRRPQ